LKLWFKKSQTTESDLPLSLFSGEKVLEKLKVAYTRDANGYLVVKGDIDLSRKNLRKLPDFSNVIVEGDFWCSDNKLESLKGAPHVVKGGFYCGDNRLSSLEYCPHTVGGNFSCSYNKLTSLEHAPQDVGENFFAASNKLKNLDQAPRTFKKLQTDFGTYRSPDEIPAHLLTQPVQAPVPEPEAVVRKPRGLNL
jgi:hypothetical protein